MVDKQEFDDEMQDKNFIDEPSQLDKYQAAAQIADGRSSFHYMTPVEQITHNSGDFDKMECLISPCFLFSRYEACHLPY